MKAKSRILRISLILLVLLVNIGCDRVSKRIAREQIEYQERVEVLGDNFILTRIENTGAFLGMGGEMSDSLRVILLIIIPLLIMISTAVYLFVKRELSYYTVVAVSFILGGGIGNLYDRIFHGSVTDFLFIDLGIFRTGIFNLADVSIMAGLGILLFEQFIIKKPVTNPTG